MNEPKMHVKITQLTLLNESFLVEPTEHFGATHRIQVYNGKKIRPCFYYNRGEFVGVGTVEDLEIIGAFSLN